ncbi:diaminopimelate epimerase, partial [Pseudomonas syringae]|uniref:diaminopimelate epimerase n=1 Tax=Pseudomonas syringae TaxID=317 RepID=UPI001F47CC8A
MPLSFHKMHANGDDFVLVDTRNSANPITSELARRLGDRHQGIGFNQLAVVLDCDDADARLQFWNADGSALDVCGSATRGAADRLMREASGKSITLRTQRGLLICERTPGGLIAVDMGQPLFDWADIPLTRQCNTLELPLPGDPSACSMGNPHCTYFVDDLGSVDIASLGPTLESHPLFPRKTNVH